MESPPLRWIEIRSPGERLCPCPRLTPPAIVAYTDGDGKRNRSDAHGPPDGGTTFYGSSA